VYSATIEWILKMSRGPGLYWAGSFRIGGEAFSRMWKSEEVKAGLSITLAGSIFVIRERIKS